MNELKSTLPTWVLIVSGIFALLELGVSVMIWTSPKSVMESIDMNAEGVDYLARMWAVRQFALGIILAYASFKNSPSMLSLCYIFLLVMFLGDLLIGITRKENSLIMTAIVMSLISAVMLYMVNKKS